MFTVEDHGSLMLVRPLTKDVDEWLHEHVDPEAQWFGKALVVEPRYLPNLLNGMIDEGFVIS